MKIAIPSYKRAETLCKKTLKYLLEDCKIDFKCITVFVANQEEYKNYINQFYIFLIVPFIHVIDGENICMSRKAYVDYLISLDCDIYTWNMLNRVRCKKST